MKISSSAFAHNQKIPSQYTCDGANINPPLTISDLPQNAQSLVLIINDPDAPAGDWVHWLVWNINPQTKEIKENSVPPGATEGITSSGIAGYGGPCPPSGEHRYFFKVYALDTKLNLMTEADKRELLQTMDEHVLDSAELIGLYSR
ncbi:MAG TPA: YbhB/YbcL family Raf kinase inhibitor-like protein [Candidatus Uhrbacteria bacterium]|nr:YbhB/YbcL family Raf kinase inhibitor-like protein [Candidatus Uhrbacteria bacterium]